MLIQLLTIILLKYFLHCSHGFFFRLFIDGEKLFCFLCKA